MNLNLFEALAEGRPLKYLKEFKSLDYPDGPWEAELSFCIDLNYGRRCYFTALKPEGLKGAKFQMTVRKDQGFRPSPDSFDMSRAEEGSIFQLLTKPDPSGFGSWLRAEKVS
ncbi:MAG: hypothetical protein JEY71_10365 [Sphaerochaeta sp.]|nr:hypothetical protein [Sphaerochaeta sp.]